ncbi:TPA: glycosyltransferase [Escherichia coli]
MRISLEENSVVFILYQFHIGGVESALINLLENIKKKRVYLIFAMNKINNELLKKIPHNVKIIGLGINNKNICHLIGYTRRLSKRYDFSRTHIVNFSDTLSTLIIQYSLNAKLKTSWVHCNPLTLINSRSFQLYKYLLVRNDKIVCLCESQKNLLIKVMPKAEKKITIIYNCVDADILSKGAQEKVDVDYKYIIKVARFDERTKDFITLIDAYCKLPKETQDTYKLVLLGDGPDLENVRNYTRKKNNMQNIFFPGKDVNPFKWIKHSQFLVHSSTSEGFSLVLLEAMLLGKVVIASDCNCGPSDILDNGNAGFLFNVGDVDSLTCIMQNLLDNQDIINIYTNRSIVRGVELQLKANRQVKEYFL